MKATYDNTGFYDKESIINVILIKNDEPSYKYVLGLLNSRLINWFYSIKFTNESKLTVNLSKEYLGKIPIKKTNDNKQFVMLVDRILSITQSEDYLQNLTKQAKVEHFKKEIDRMVYDLYGLTEEEIRIVEGEKS